MSQDLDETNQANERLGRKLAETLAENERLTRELADARRERDNALSGYRQADTDTPETDAVHQAQTQDDPALCQEYFAMMDHAEEMERQRNECKAIVNDLEAECTRLHGYWTTAEQRANVAEARMKDRDERIRKLANASSVLWTEHKEYSIEKHGTEGCDYHGTDSEGGAMMQRLVDETLSLVSGQNIHSSEPKTTHNP
jgi:chromosome segregation ATPase